jgi:hypothetical protein
MTKIFVHINDKQMLPNFAYFDGENIFSFPIDKFHVSSEDIILRHTKFRHIFLTVYQSDVALCGSGPGSGALIVSSE